MEPFALETSKQCEIDFLCEEFYRYTKDTDEARRRALWLVRQAYSLGEKRGRRDHQHLLEKAIAELKKAGSHD